MYSYCLFCNTVKSALVAEAIRQKFGYVAYSPKIVQRKWIKGTCHEEIKDYLPGYVFVYTEEPITRFREIWQMEGMLRFLGQRDQFGFVFGNVSGVVLRGGVPRVIDGVKDNGGCGDQQQKADAEQNSPAFGEL